VASIISLHFTNAALGYKVELNTTYIIPKIRPTQTYYQPRRRRQIWIYRIKWPLSLEELQA